MAVSEDHTVKLEEKTPQVLELLLLVYNCVTELVMRENENSARFHIRDQGRLESMVVEELDFMKHCVSVCKGVLHGRASVIGRRYLYRFAPGSE